nr:hypothetical protein Iba_chr10bCG10390 [Ipomoea batatas]GME12215.1 hypothetical protein Iba_scaffold13492CG0350 [Ipomoea batatas]
MESWSPNGATATEKEMDGERGLVGWILEVADGNGEHLRSPVGMEVAGGNGGRHFRSVSLYYVFCVAVFEALTNLACFRL